MVERKNDCSCCRPVIEVVSGPVDRRSFLKSAGTAAITAAGLSGTTSLLGVARPAPVKKAAEDHVRLFYDALKPEQRKAICFPFDHPLRSAVNNNWHIVPQKMGEFLDKDQLEHCRQILKGITSEDGYERFQKSMEDDAGGFGEYSCAVFGDPGGDRYQWVITGRHLTLRADGNTTANTAFGGPIFYGHAVTFKEEPDHPGNVWWHQGRAANELFAALDGKQREAALLEESPPDNPSTVHLRGNGLGIGGLAGVEMSRDQRGLLRKTLRTMLGMFRESDVKEILQCLKTNGGLRQARVAFYKAGDTGEDGTWDRWRVEGPSFVWYFRGSPHVHTWVNIAHSGPKWI